MLKKKIKDLTLEECKRICEDYDTCKYDCPLHKVCSELTFLFEDEDLEQVVEVDYE